MSLRACLLTAVLLAVPAAAGAESAPSTAPPAPRADLTAVLGQAEQALLLDRIRGEYVVVKPGDQIQGLVVTAIESDRIVLSTTGAERHHFVIALAKPAPKPAPKPASPGTELVKNPYADPSPAAPPPPAAAKPTPPTAPKAVPIPVPGANAPIDPYAPAPVTTAPASPAPADPPPVLPPAAAAASTPAAAEVADLTVQMARSEFDGALADFTVLASQIQVRPEGERLRVLTVTRGSFLYRLGLRKGDLIAWVAGERIHQIDRAARVYAQLMRVDRFMIKLYRGSQRIRLQVELKR